MRFENYELDRRKVSGGDISEEKAREAMERHSKVESRKATEELQEFINNSGLTVEQAEEALKEIRRRNDMDMAA